MGSRDISSYEWHEKLRTRMSAAYKFLLLLTNFCCCLQIFLLLTNFCCCLQISLASYKFLLLLRNSVADNKQRGTQCHWPKGSRLTYKFCCCLQILLLLTNFIAAYKFSVCIFAAYKLKETPCATELLQHLVESKNVSWPNVEYHTHHVVLKGGGGHFPHNPAKKKISLSRS